MTAPAYRLPAAQRQTVIDSIRKTVLAEGRLEQTPDDLLLATLHALTGRTADLIRHVTAAAQTYYGA